MPDESRREHLALVDDQDISGVEELHDVREPKVTGTRPGEHKQSTAVAPRRRIARDQFVRDLVLVVGDERAVWAPQDSSTKSVPWGPFLASAIVYPRRWNARGVATRPWAVRIKKPSMIKKGS